MYLSSEVRHCRRGLEEAVITVGVFFFFLMTFLLPQLPVKQDVMGRCSLVLCFPPASFPQPAIQQTQAGADPGTSDAAFAGEPHPLRGGPLCQHVPAAGARSTSLHPAGRQEAVGGPQHGDAAQVRELCFVFFCYFPFYIPSNPEKSRVMFHCDLLA